MNQDHLSALLAAAGAKKDSEGWIKAPDGRHVTLHAAFNGVGLTVSRVGAVRVEGQLLHARTAKGDLFILALSDVFAGAVEGGSATGRKAGFV
jgi:hypothetical protein